MTTLLTMKGFNKKGWTPGANTLAYYKFDGNLNDSSGNNHPCTVAYGSTVYYTVSGDNKAITCSGNVMKSGIGQQDVLAANHTLSFWVNLSPTQIDNRVMGGLGVTGNVCHIGMSIGSAQGYCFYIWQPTGTYRKRTYTFSANTWYNIVLTINSSFGVNCYINGTQVGTTNTINSPSTIDFYLGANYLLTDSQRMNGYLDDVIIENKTRTAQEISDYFNQTKGDYGIQNLRSVSLSNVNNLNNINSNLTINTPTITNQGSGDVLYPTN